jgi:hypothetical protein
MINFSTKSGTNPKLFLDPTTGEPTSKAAALRAEPAKF